MSLDGLVLGLLDTSDAIGDPIAAAKYRGFTISWSRYGYHDVIIEKQTIDEILTEANAFGFRYCLVQSYGHIIQERWTPGCIDLFAALAESIAEADFLVMGSIVSQPGCWFGFRPGCLLVDLQTHRRLSAPCFDLAYDGPAELPRAEPIIKHDRITALLPADDTDTQKPGMFGWHFISASLKSGIPVRGFGEDVVSRTLDLEPTCALRAQAFAPYLDDGIGQYRGASSQDGLSTDQRAFLNIVQAQTANARNGVFLWNIESYADVETPRHDFKGPVSSLYSVAAGLKPNRILQTHGFDDESRVVYFDYSPNALEVKKCMVEEWDGEDFPHFVKYLFKTFPHPETFYQLWEDLTPSEVDWKDIEVRWQRELNRWGGAGNFGDHWRAYRDLRHEFVCCDLLRDPSPLLTKMASESSAIMWWSNAFFTMYGNWFYSLDERKRAYEHWIEQIADTNPDLYVFGSDYNNTNVNSIQAAEYWIQYRDSAGSSLSPCRLGQMGIRM